MTAKSRRPQRVNQKPNNSLGRGFVGAVLGVTLLLTVGNVYRAVSSFERQQLIPTTSEFFASDKYQPLLIGKKALDRQNFESLDLIAKQLDYNGSSVKELAALLAQNATTEADKARIIYAWITQHITYDFAAFQDALQNNNYPDVNPTKVLRDIARLFVLDIVISIRL